MRQHNCNKMAKRTIKLNADEDDALGNFIVNSTLLGGNVPTITKTELRGKDLFIDVVVDGPAGSVRSMNEQLLPELFTFAKTAAVSFGLACLSTADACASCIPKEYRFAGHDGAVFRITMGKIYLAFVLSNMEKVEPVGLWRDGFVLWLCYSTANFLFG